MRQMKNVLVTGAAGFIGSHFVAELLTKETHVHVYSYDKLTYAGCLANLEPVQHNARHHFIQGDINDYALVRTTLRNHQIDTIVHFAAESHVDNSIATPAIFFETNVMGTLNLLQAAKEYWLDEKSWSKDHCRFHHISTDEVYGSLMPDDPAFTETTPYSPNSPYAASKAGSDHAVRAYGKTFGLPVTISNCSNNYGPHQHAEKLIPTVIRCCLEGRSIPVYGNGRNCRDWLYVGDHCEAIYAILQRGTVGEVYNVGGGYEADNLSLIAIICQIMDKAYPQKAPHQDLVQFVADRKGHDFRYAIDNAKICHALAWQPNTAILTGLEQTVDFYISQYAKDSV
jgi:dTDP-glucose 4,6-dehydratase